MVIILANSSGQIVGSLVISPDQKETALASVKTGITAIVAPAGMAQGGNTSGLKIVTTTTPWTLAAA
jgi:hypothetical protein